MEIPTLSGECLRHIEELDRDYREKYPSEEDRNMTNMFRDLTRRVIESREGFTGAGLEAVEELVRADPGFFADQVDDFLTRLVLDQIPEMARRFIQLSKLDAIDRPSKASSTYIQEAARTYVYGFPQACAAISRAALEQALKERLGRQGNGEFIRFQDLVEEAKKWNLLDATTAKMVRETASKADLVLHEGPTDHNGAFQVLIETRALLQQVYSADGSY